MNAPTVAVAEMFHNVNFYIGKPVLLQGTLFVTRGRCFLGIVGESVSADVTRTVLIARKGLPEVLTSYTARGGYSTPGEIKEITIGGTLQNSVVDGFTIMLTDVFYCQVVNPIVGTVEIDLDAIERLRREAFEDVDDPPCTPEEREGLLQSLRRRFDEW